MIAALLLATLPLEAAQKTVRMNDASDWWSIVRGDLRGQEVKPRDKDIESSNFKIAGIRLGESFEEIAAKLGRTTVVERGDAADGRQQVCYGSPARTGQVYLIFEFGEGEDSIFYLIRDPKPWQGSRLCTISRSLSPLSTPSGLRLGMQRSQLEAVLGTPDWVSGDRLIYSREINKRSSPEEFQRQRQEYPEKLTDEQAHQKFDFYTLYVYIEAKFTNSGLSYLAVSKSP